MPGMNCQLRANQYMCDVAKKRFACFGITFPTAVSQTIGHNEIIRFILIVPTSIEKMNKLVKKKPDQQYLWVNWRIQVLLLKRFDAASRERDISLAEFAELVTQDVQQLRTPKKTCREEADQAGRDPPPGGPPPLLLPPPETDDDTSQPLPVPRLDQIDTFCLTPRRTPKGWLTAGTVRISLMARFILHPRPRAMLLSRRIQKRATTRRQEDQPAVQEDGENQT